MRGHKMMNADVLASNGSHYAMLLPGDLVPSHLNDSAASLEYEDSTRELYVEVVSDSKAKIVSFDLDYDLETYMKIASKQIDPEGLYVNKPLTIGTNKALQTEIILKNKKNQNMHYKLTCIETPKYFYQVLSFTTDVFLEQNKTDMDLMVNSFKEIDK